MMENTKLSLALCTFLCVLVLCLGTPVPINVIVCGSGTCDGKIEYCETPEASVCAMCDDLCAHEVRFPACQVKCARFLEIREENERLAQIMSAIKESIGDVQKDLQEKQRIDHATNSEKLVQQNRRIDVIEWNSRAVLWICSTLLILIICLATVVLYWHFTLKHTTKSVDLVDENKSLKEYPSPDAPEFIEEPSVKKDHSPSESPLLDERNTCRNPPALHLNSITDTQGVNDRVELQTSGGGEFINGQTAQVPSDS